MRAQELCATQAEPARGLSRATIDVDRQVRESSPRLMVRAMAAWPATTNSRADKAKYRFPGTRDLASVAWQTSLRAPLRALIWINPPPDTRPPNAGNGRGGNA